MMDNCFTNVNCVMYQLKFYFATVIHETGNVVNINAEIWNKYYIL